MGAKFLIFLTVCINQTCWTATDPVWLQHHGEVLLSIKCRGWTLQCSAMKSAEDGYQHLTQLQSPHRSYNDWHTFLIQNHQRKLSVIYVLVSSDSYMWVDTILFYLCNIPEEQSFVLCRPYDRKAPVMGLVSVGSQRKAKDITKDISCSSLGFPQSCTLFLDDASAGIFNCYFVCCNL